MAATTWISTGSTSWNTGANWSLGTVPTSADDVTFNATSVINCTCDVAISCASINVTSGYSGTLNFGSGSYNHSIALDTVFAGTGTVDRGNATLTVGGNYNISSQGTFTNSSGVTILTGTGKTLTSSTTNRPRNITVQTGASITFTSTGIGFAYGAWTINGSLTLSSTFQGLSEPTWIINGTVTGTAYQQIKNCSITLNGTGTITGQLFLWLEGQVFTHNGGTIGPDVYLQLYLSSTITGASPFTLTAKGVRFKGSSAAYTTTIAQSITFDCPVVNLHTEAGLLTISTSGSNPSLTFKKDVNLYNTGSITWQKGTGTITLSGTAAQSINFNALSVETIVVDKTAGTATFEANVSPTAFTVSQGTVNINGKTITTTQHVTAAAGTTVNDTVGGGKFVVGGNFAANGTSGSGVIWNGPDLQITGTATANYATVTNSNATGGTEVTATNSTDSGGNTNWVFGPAAGETIDLTGLTGDFTLSVYGTAAVTVAAGTATGTGFGQATEGNPVTFNLSVTGTVTLTLDSGTLDTYQGAAMKQVEQGAVSTPFIKTSGGPGSRTIDQILHPWSEAVLSQAQGSIILKVKLKQGTFTPTADRGLVTIHTSVNNMLYLNSGDSISVESFDGTTAATNSGVVVQSADDELGIYLSYADSTEYPASGNISVGLKNLTTGSAWAEATGNYDGGYPATGGLLRLMSQLTAEADIEGFTVYDSHQVPAVLRGYFTSGVVFEDYSQGGYTFGGEVAEVLSDGLYSLTESAYYAHLKTTSDNANYSNVVKSSGIYPLMTSDGVLVVTAYLVNGTPAGADDRLEIRLSSDNFSTKSIIGNVYLKHYKKGWNYLAIPCTKFTSGNGELISSQMNYLNMRLHNAGGGESVEIYIGGIWYNPRARPKLIIDFDDGFDSVYDTAYPYLSSNSLVASVSVIKDRVGTAGYCTLPELTEMHNAGWGMTVHGDSQHSALVTQEAITTDINANKAYIAANLPGSEQHYIYPGGSVLEDTSFSALTAAGMVTGRMTDQVYECVVNGYGDLRAMAAQPMSHAAGLNALKDYVDDVIRCGLTLVLYGHKVVSSISDANNEILDTDFQLLVDHIALKRDQGLIDVVTRADWYASLDRR